MTDTTKLNPLIEMLLTGGGCLPRTQLKPQTAFAIAPAWLTWR